jgi:hypothetical protein
MLALVQIPPVPTAPEYAVNNYIIQRPADAA